MTSSAKRTLSIDIETYSSVNLKECGVYKYAESPDFEILLFGYSLDGNERQVVDLASGESIPSAILSLLEDDSCLKYAFNAQFERVCLSRQLGYPVGEYLDPRQWRCTRVMASYVGLPMSLDEVGRVLNLDNKKLSEGKSLIAYYCLPCKPTKKNGGRTRNYYYHDPAKWELFKLYNDRDVEVEMSIQERLRNYPVPDFVWEEYFLDQAINDRGVKIDEKLVQKAIEIDEISTKELSIAMKSLSELENPNSVSQLKAWLMKFGVDTDDLGKKKVAELKEQFEGGVVGNVMSLRLMLGKTSIKKYLRMKDAVNSDGRVRGMFSFYGANRTGRFSSKIIQLQNLPQNHLSDLSVARELLLKGDIEPIKMLYEDVPDFLSQLIRTAFVADEGKKFIVCDFSAIEARVLAWLSGEEWRNEAFRRGADIYVSSASQMFGIEESSVTKALRQKGKISELALGYGGSVGALTSMGAIEMGVEADELPHLVKAWRGSNPHITEFWWEVDDLVKKVVKEGRSLHQRGIDREVSRKLGNLSFSYKKSTLFITLPSGRTLAYPKANIGLNRFGEESVTYEGVGENKHWTRIESYGPKFVENIVQGVARDLLCNSIKNLGGYRIVMHIHDEVVVEADADTPIEEIRERMLSEPSWAEGLCLNASGYETPFYKKD